MSIATEISAARARAVDGHADRVRAYAERRFAETDQAMGVQGRTEGSADLGGEIARVYPDLRGAIGLALSTLREHSTVDSGDYRDSHTVIVDGAPVEWPARLSPRAQVLILSALPYARRIEQGWSDQAPNGVYEVAAAIVAARANVEVTVEYVAPPVSMVGNATPATVPAMIFRMPP
jgi:hypothetical protein